MSIMWKKSFLPWFYKTTQFFMWSRIFAVTLAPISIAVTVENIEKAIRAWIPKKKEIEGIATLYYPC